MTPRPRRPGPAVLVLRALGLGDALTAVPALRGLRRAFPGQPLLLAAAGPPADLLLAHGIVDGVVPTPDLDAAAPGRGLGPHIAVNLHGRGPQSHRLLLDGAPTRLVAFAHDDVPVPGPAWRADEHEVHRWCRLARWVGGRCEPAELLLDPDPAVEPDPDPPGHPRRTRPRTGPVVVHPGASTGDRRWPGRRFAAVARRLAAAGHPVVVTGSAAEAGLCARVATEAGLAPAADLAGRLDLPGLARLLTSSRLLVCGDTGVGHLATALGTPSVLLFGPVPPTRWGPAVGTDRHQVIWHGPAARPRPVRPASTRPDPLLLDITVGEALDAALAQLRRRDHPTPR